MSDNDEKLQEWFAEESNECGLTRLVRKLSPPVARVLEKALGEKDLTEDEGSMLARTEGSELRALLSTADLLRKRAVGDTITYVIARNINFTNICSVGCTFCAFRREPHSPNAVSFSLEEIGNRAKEAWQRGATEVCVQGGLAKDLRPTLYRDILLAIKEAAPGIHIHAFSPMEVIYGAEKMEMALPDYLKMLSEAGLGSLPGTAAEMLVPEIRKIICPDKMSVEQWVRVIRTAHSLGIPTTCTMMYGHVERPEHWVQHLLLLRSIQQETGGFTEIVPLGFMHKNTELYQRGGARPGPSITEHLKVHALARVLLKGWVDHVQVSWVKMGRRLCQTCLNAGADDFGGTLMEENISRLAGSQEGQNMEPEEFRKLIWGIKRVPAQRSTTYEILNRFPPSRE